MVVGNYRKSARQLPVHVTSKPHYLRDALLGKFNLAKGLMGLVVNFLRY
jgi:hypothetical protein